VLKGSLALKVITFVLEGEIFILYSVATDSLKVVLGICYDYKSVICTLIIIRLLLLSWGISIQIT